MTIKSRNLDGVLDWSAFGCIFVTLWLIVCLSPFASSPSQHGELDVLPSTYPRLLWNQQTSAAPKCCHVQQRHKSKTDHNLRQFWAPLPRESIWKLIPLNILSLSRYRLIQLTSCPIDAYMWITIPICTCDKQFIRISLLHLLSLGRCKRGCNNWGFQGCLPSLPGNWPKSAIFCLFSPVSGEPEQHLGISGEIRMDQSLDLGTFWRPCEGPSPELWWMSGRFSWIWLVGSPKFAKVRMKARTCLWYTLEPPWLMPCFQGKSVWINRPESSWKVSLQTGSGTWMALPSSNFEILKAISSENNLFLFV